jgi:glutamine---fructose-6-phosphate transaminase (isomerizing)
MEQNNLHVSILGENLLEPASFKTGFAGIMPSHDKNRAMAMSKIQKSRLVAFYLGQYIKNPALINSSLYDTFDAFKSYYVINHNVMNMFKYKYWDESQINSTLQEVYDWETDPETTTTWRIGDGSTAFYNYIYYMVAGFTENDTFRSNQIRENMITRAEAEKKIVEENKPRWESIKWYCDTIDIDFEMAIGVINNVKKLYDT